MLVRFLPAARSDIINAVDYYEVQQSGLGGALRNSLNETLQAIAEFPRRYRRFGVDSRRAPIAGFPFGVIYVIEDDSILVQAVYHSRRSPDTLQTRIK